MEYEPSARIRPMQALNHPFLREDIEAAAAGGEGDAGGAGGGGGGGGGAGGDPQDAGAAKT